MIEVSEAFKAAVINGTVNNQLTIIVFGYYEDGSNLYITNKDIVSESMTIEQAISDENDLKFGGCIAGSFEIEISNMPNLTGKYITVQLTQRASMPISPGSIICPGNTTYPGSLTYPGGLADFGGSVFTETFDIFSGEVYSCTFTKNRLTRKLVAYDRFYWRGNIDCTNWYKKLYENKAEISLLELRKAICDKFMLVEEDDSVTLPADNLKVQMIEDNVTVSDLLRMLCEFNGVFLYFNGSGNLRYCNLNVDYVSTEEYEFYINAEREDFTKEPYTGIYFSLSDGCWAWYQATDENLYFEQYNALIITGYDDKYRLGTHISEYFPSIKPNLNIEYTPLNLKAETRLWVQLGDRVKLKIKWYSLQYDSDENEHSEEHEDIVYSYVLSRRIKGIQALIDEITAKGENTHYTEDSDFDGV